MAVFMAAKQRYVVHLRPEDVAEALRRDGHWEQLSPEQVGEALDSLEGWGNLRAGLQCTIAAICSAPPTGRLPDSQFVSPADAPSARQILLNEYFSITDLLDKGKYDKAKTALTKLQTDITTFVKDPSATALNLLITTQIAKQP